MVKEINSSSTETCVLCGRDISESFAWCLCDTHWEEYKKLAKDNFKEFKKFRAKIDDMFKSMTILD